MSKHKLDYAIRVLALESSNPAALNDAFSSFIPKISGYMQETKTSITNSVAKVTGLFKSITAQYVEDGGNVEGYSNDMVESLEHIKYMNLSTHGHYLVSVPENFKGDFLPYAKTVTKALTDTRLLFIESHQQYSTILKSFITNKDDRISLKDHTAFFKKLDGEVDEVAKAMDKFFPDRTGKTKAKLKDVIGRVSDIEELYDLSVKLSQINNKDNMFILQTKVNELSELLDLVTDHVRDGTITGVSGAAALNLANGAKTMGELVREYAALSFDALIFTNIVNNLAKSINDSFTNGVYDSEIHVKSK